LHYTLALVFFCLAGATDFLDGRIARARNLITNFGKLMDPLADKIMTCSAFVAFVESTHMDPARAGEGRGVDGGDHRRA
jgi:CDP-diacylglycerol--glycerol-3-phosphate 3-phosphatidyltransferase